MEFIEGVGFEPFPKMARLRRDVVVTEKIDGTNAQIFISDSGEMKVGSRTRYITPQDDNAGFAKWAYDHKEDLLKLGPGRHFGEWWGSKIQRGYGLTEKRFSLFNSSRWNDDGVRPPCCGVVPVLYDGVFSEAEVNQCLERLRVEGSVAAPAFMNPEGVVVYHVAAAMGFKITLEGDGVPKSVWKGSKVEGV